jgi:uncharacterized protein YqiB (DUF1249 family)
MHIQLSGTKSTLFSALGRRNKKGVNRTSCKRYSIDLVSLHATCESNYARLLRLFPDYETANYREFQLSGGQRVRIDVVERCRYTTLMKVCQHGSPANWMTPPRFDLRVYHDARMVEVTAFQSRQRVDARYEYPNPAMLARDEKAQQNQFLSDWLSHCLAQGRATGDLSRAVDVS